MNFVLSGKIRSYQELLGGYRRYAVVYQPGKVASLSLEALFAQLPDTVASQAHFLGRNAFVNAIDNILASSTPNALRWHNEGQLVKNLRAQFIINTIRSGQGEGRELIFVCPVRYPVEFLRSALNQRYDIYESILFEGAGAGARDGKALAELLSGFVASADRHLTDIGLDLSVAKTAQYVDWLTADSLPGASRELLYAHRMVFGHLGRLDMWLAGLADVVGVTVADLSRRSPYLLSKKLDAGAVYLFRYEDLDAALKDIIREQYGADVKYELPQKNRSEDKAGFDVVGEAFRDERLRAQLEDFYRRHSPLRRLLYSED